MMTPYHYYFNRFCLYSHLTKRINPNNLEASDESVLKLTISAAFDLLNMFSNLGPQGMYRIRYMSGFCPETFAFCSIFVLRCVEAFPAWFCEMRPQLDLIKDIAVFIGDLDIEGSTSRSILGESLQKQVAAAVGKLDTIRESRDATELSATCGSCNVTLATESTLFTDGWHTVGSVADTGIELDPSMFNLDPWLDFV